LLELPKAPKVMGKGTMLENWLGFIGAKSEEEIEMAEKSNPMIGKAVGRYRVLSGEERAQELERLRINEEQLKGELIHDAVEKGIKLGEGRSAATIAQYQAQLSAKDAQYQAQLSAKDAQLSAKDAELAALKQQLAQARR
jgi:DNA-directed RNA polymerase subunit H (RpoH/RPB5)